MKLTEYPWRWQGPKLVRILPRHFRRGRDPQKPRWKYWTKR